MTRRDYYEILGLPRNTSDEAIKKAYRQKALQYHPDRNPGDKDCEEKFKEASEAYEVLRDSEKRSLYDRFGHDGLKNSGFSGFSGFEDIFSSFGDIFEDFFGLGGFGGRRRNRSSAVRGADMRYDISIPLEEAAFGVERKIEITKPATCDECNGTGCDKGTSLETCRTCHGSGRVTRSQGFFSIATTCSTCRGTGSFIPNPCSKCKGSGKIQQKKSLKVRIPAGVESGMRLKLSNEGEAGERGGVPGDLYVFINIEEHPVFKRHNNHIVFELPVSFSQAALGAETEVPTLNGNEKIKIPKGIETGDYITIKGAGIPDIQGYGKGDQIVQFVLKTPKKLSKREQEIFEELAKVEQEEQDKGFFKTLFN